MYAIVETGGKQYKVSPGQTIDVAKLGVTKGEKVDLDRVLLIADGDKVTVGKPAIEGAKVVATSHGDGRTKKTIVFTYKAKVRYSKKKGHHQDYTRLTIDQIVGPGIVSDEPVKEVSGAKKEVIEGGS